MTKRGSGRPEESPEGLRTTHLEERPSKVTTEAFALPVAAGMDLRRFLASLPRVLAGEQIREAAGRVADAARGGREIIAGMGAHVIKVGLAPVLGSWMDEGVLTALALNGAGVIHDVEIALAGKTSEDVGPALDEGLFGVAEETARFILGAVAEGDERGEGFGEAVARRLAESDPPFGRYSLLCRAHEKGLPVTVHVALGTDIIHMHPQADGAVIGRTSLRDFQRLATRVARLEGGVYLNIGSAVILPEVFLKALNLARNRGHPVRDLTTIDMDFIRHYRPRVNVVERPVRKGGRGFQFVGHHELMVPLLAAAVLEYLRNDGKPGGAPP